MKKLMFDRRQALGLGASAFAALGLAACSEGPSDSGSTSSSSSSSSSTTEESSVVEIDKDAFDKLIASVAQADDATIEANAWAKAIKERGSFNLGATRTSVLFSQLNEQDNVTRGFDAGIYLSLIRYILGSETAYEYTQVTSDTRESVLQNDTVDAVFATYSITDKRKEVIDFAGPYFSTQQGILVAASNTDINSLADLAGKKVAVQSGSTGPTVLAEYAPEAVAQEFTKDDECRTALEQGRVDAYVVDQTLHMGNIVKNPGKYRLAGDAFGPEDNYGIGIKKGSDGVEFVNAFLKRFEEDGTWAKLYKIAIADRCGLSTTPEPPAIGA
ncbi:glutamate ABC transporter substrate-binding protein [Paratractidigestivibacter sp.]|uniref:glutamate ABC transporter substrate-binding protein n=1 Tax=Paratractidigestivibacter sp. TaxID=2847316 RepID=UPI002AC8E75C|nr:glutamate ABC transporter substrate-binding protein [Paratractidigestivibacter sp.]